MTLNRPVNAFIDLAARQLLEGDGPKQDTMLFMGNWHEAYPALLIRDPHLTDSAKVQMLFLLQEARRHGFGTMAMPSIDEVATAVHQSPRVAARDRALLRITRWISRCRRVLDEAGQVRGLIHAVHTEPCSMADATDLDADFMAMLDRSARNQDEAIRLAAEALLRGIRRTVDQGGDPLEQADAPARRMAATQIAVQGPVSPSQAPDNGLFFEAVSSVKSPSADSAPGDLGDISPSADSAPGDFAQSRSCQYKVPVSNLVSNLNKKNNLVTPCIEDSSERSVSCAGSAVQSSGLIWPTEIEENERRSFLYQLDRVPLVQRQDILNQLAWRLRAPDRSPLKNVSTYHTKLCNLAVEGKFVPIAGPIQRTPKARVITPPRHGTQARELRSMIDHLSSMADSSPSPIVQAQLREQLNTARRQLDEVVRQSGSAGQGGGA